MKAQILGSGCAKCKLLEELACEAVEHRGEVFPDLRIRAVELVASFRGG